MQTLIDKRELKKVLSKELSWVTGKSDLVRLYDLVCKVIDDFPACKNTQESKVYDPEEVKRAESIIRGVAEITSQESTIQPDGLYKKYIVQKTDGSPIDPKARYIILRVDDNGATTELEKTYRAAARGGVAEFARKIADFAPGLSEDLIALVGAPKAERINTAREMIEAEVDRTEKSNGYTAAFAAGKIGGMLFALSCLDKPAEPMVSVAEVRKAFELARYYDRTELFDKWLKEKEATHE